jgi:hypothetical protein
MEPNQDDSFVLFIRADRNHRTPPEKTERPLFVCSSYEEARRLRRELLDASQECVIRFLGAAGGGD